MKNASTMDDSAFEEENDYSNGSDLTAEGRTSPHESGYASSGERTSKMNSKPNGMTSVQNITNMLQELHSLKEDKSVEMAGSSTKMNGKIVVMKPSDDKAQSDIIQSGMLDRNHPSPKRFTVFPSASNIVDKFLESVKNKASEVKRVQKWERPYMRPGPRSYQLRCQEARARGRSRREKVDLENVMQEITTVFERQSRTSNISMNTDREKALLNNVDELLQILDDESPSPEKSSNSFVPTIVDIRGNIDDDFGDKEQTENTKNSKVPDYMSNIDDIRIDEDTTESVSCDEAKDDDRIDDIRIVDENKSESIADENIVDIPIKNDSDNIPTDVKMNASVPMDSVADVPTNDVINVLMDDVNIPADDVANLPADDVTNVSTNIAVVLTDDIANVPSDDATNVPSEDVNVPKDDVVNVRTDDAVSVGHHVKIEEVLETDCKNEDSKLLSRPLNDKPQEVVNSENMDDSKMEIDLNEDFLGDDVSTDDFPFNAEELKEIAAELDDFGNFTSEINIDDVLFLRDTPSSPPPLYPTPPPAPQSPQTPSELPKSNSSSVIFTSGYRCHLCRCRFVEPEALNAHMDEHRASREHKCDECNRTFPTALQLRQHVAAHDKLYACTVCGKRFDEAAEYKIHLRREHDVGRNITDEVEFSVAQHVVNTRYFNPGAVRMRMRTPNITLGQYELTAEERRAGKKYFVRLYADALQKRTGRDVRFDSIENVPVAERPPKPFAEQVRRIGRIDENFLDILNLPSSAVSHITKFDQYDFAFDKLCARRMRMIKRKAIANDGKVDSKYLRGPLFWKKALYRTKLTDKAKPMGHEPPSICESPALRMQKKAEAKLNTLRRRSRAGFRMRPSLLRGPRFWKRTLQLAGVKDITDLEDAFVLQRPTMDNVQFEYVAKSPTDVFNVEEFHEFERVLKMLESEAELPSTKSRSTGVEKRPANDTFTTPSFTKTTKSILPLPQPMVEIPRPPRLSTKSQRSKASPLKTKPTERSDMDRVNDFLNFVDNIERNIVNTRDENELALSVDVPDDNIPQTALNSYSNVSNPEPPPPVADAFISAPSPDGLDTNGFDLNSLPTLMTDEQGNNYILKENGHWYLVTATGEEDTSTSYILVTDDAGNMQLVKDNELQSLVGPSPTELQQKLLLGMGDEGLQLLQLENGGYALVPSDDNIGDGDLSDFLKTMQR